MKVKELCNDVLEEGISSIVYHYTKLWQFARIASSDTINLSLAANSYRELNLSNQKFFYLSTSRSRVGQYHHNAGYAAPDVLITLDGRALSTRYKGNAVNYFSNQDGYEDDDEMEDRIFSDSPQISNISKYIKQIDIRYKSVDEFRFNQDNKKTLINVLLYAKRKNIPVFMYDDNHSWISNKQNFSINPIYVLRASQSVDKEKSSGWKSDRLRMPKLSDNKILLQLLTTNTSEIEKLAKETKEELRRAFLSFRGANFVLSSDGDLETLSALAREMRRLGIKDTVSLNEYILEKWRGFIQL